MRIHRLEMNEFMTFKGSVVIDFDEIAQDSLFLLFGETGAGKTSILDAISYALFGETSRIGKKKGLENLRCQYSDEANPTSVTLEITVAGQRYKVTRTLAQVREVGHNVKASLVVSIAQGDGWMVPESLTKVSEGDAFLQSKIGLDANQFFQVVMLPQGKFQKFLESSTNDREEILMTLFRADRFTEIEKWFKEEHLRLKGLLNTADEALRFIAGQIEQSVADPEHFDIENLNLDWLTLKLSTASEEVKASEVLVGQHQVEVERHREIVNGHKLNKEQQVSYRILQNSFNDADMNLQEFIEYLKSHEIIFDSIDTGSAIKLSDTLNSWQREMIELQEKLQGNTRASELQSSIRDLQVSLVTLTKDLELVQEELVSAQTTMSHGATAGVELGKAIESKNKAQDLLEDLKALSKLENEREVSKENLRSAEATQVEVFAEVEQLSAAREKSIAAELAEALKDGQACVVCGSVEHPSPASRIEGHVDKSDLDASRMKKEQVDKDVTVLRTSLSNLTAQIEELRNAVGEGVSLTIQHAEKRLAESKLLVDDLQSKVDRANAVDLNEIQARKNVLDAEITEIQRQVALQKQELSGLQVIDEGSELTLGLEKLEKRVTLANEEDWANKLAQLVNLRHTAKSALDASNVVNYSAEEHEEAQQAFDSASSLLKNAQKALTTAQNKELMIREKSDSYKQNLKDYIEAECNYSIVKNTYQIIAGNAAIAEVKKVALQSYYLSTRFDQVLQYANVRLAKMSGNQFVLVRNEGEGGRGQSHLDINIYDAWTGRNRPTYGISGGETFMVSLSLALGLADAVINSAGVAPFESLFIDEGFGSLGPVTLDAVMETLFDLQAGDRAIGVISHVATMAERIPRQIHVKKENGGSSVSFHYASA